jgi:cytochrome c oxidase subunit II
MRRFAVLLTVFLASGTGLAGCGDDDAEVTGDDDTGRSVAITAGDFSFEPSQVELDAGAETTLEVENAGAVGHNLTIEDLDVDEDVGPGESTSVSVAPQERDYEFYCKFHRGQMTGTLTVG